jgi:hypothetical protein
MKTILFFVFLFLSINLFAQVEQNNKQKNTTSTQYFYGLHQQ